MNNDNVVRLNAAPMFALLMFGAALLLAGCGSTSESAPPDYTIEPGPAVPEGATIYAEDEVDQAPEVVNGDAMYDAISYPREAAMNGVQGTVRVAFVVGPDGTVYEPEVVQSVAPALDHEAVRAIRATRWQPGIMQDTAVYVRTELPVGFFVN